MKACCRAYSYVHTAWLSVIVFSEMVSISFFLRINCIYLFMAAVGLRCCAGFSLVVASRGCSVVVVRGLLILVASLVAEHKLWSRQASVV